MHRKTKNEKDDFPTTLVTPLDSRMGALHARPGRGAKGHAKSRPAPLIEEMVATPQLKAAASRFSTLGAARTATAAQGVAAVRAATTASTIAAAATGAAAVAQAASKTPALRLVVSGFSPVERSLLEGTVKLSQRRTPRLNLLADSEVDDADVVMINALDPLAMEWARHQPVLARKAVIWVDGQSAPPGHMLAKRPVQWPILPILLARALEQGPAFQGKLGASAFGELDPAAAAAADRGAIRPVLIVDDSRAVRAQLRSLLEKHGYHVVDVENVQAALDALASTSFACVLMDVLMPGADGYEGCKQIKAKLRGVAKVPVIILTSKSSPFDRIRGKMAGCDAYLTKPVDPHQLHETLGQLVAQRSGPDAANAPSSHPARTTPAMAPPILSLSAIVD